LYIHHPCPAVSTSSAHPRPCDTCAKIGTKKTLQTVCSVFVSQWYEIGKSAPRRRLCSTDLFLVICLLFQKKCLPLQRIFIKGCSYGNTDNEQALVVHREPLAHAERPRMAGWQAHRADVPCQPLRHQPFGR